MPPRQAPEAQEVLDAQADPGGRGAHTVSEVALQAVATPPGHGEQEVQAAAPVVTALKVPAGQPAQYSEEAAPMMKL